MDFEVNASAPVAEEETVIPSKKPSVFREIFEWIDTVVIALLAVVVIFTFLFRVATIVGPSMQNTLYSGEKIIISDIMFEPKYGDIVVVSRNVNNKVYNDAADSEPIIKRVIATEGQFVDIDFSQGKVYVGYDLSNMTELDEPYIKNLTTRRWDVEFPLYVTEGHIFVMGDNREDSLDSRSSSIGLIDERYILGKAVYRIWPFDRIGGLSLDE